MIFTRILPLGSPNSVVSNVRDFDIVLSEFELQLCFYIEFLISLGKV